MITGKEGWTKKCENVRWRKRKIIKAVIKPVAPFLIDPTNIIWYQVPSRVLC